MSPSGEAAKMGWLEGPRSSGSPRFPHSSRVLRKGCGTGSENEKRQPADDIFLFAKMPLLPITLKLSFPPQRECFIGNFRQVPA
jgi:hypothetical protein